MAHFGGFVLIKLGLTSEGKHILRVGFHNAVHTADHTAWMKSIQDSAEGQTLHVDIL